MSIELNIFEQALRMKLLFTTGRVGSIGTEDLWHLPLTSINGLNLDEVAMAIQRRINARGDVTSFVSPGKKADDLDLSLAVVKRVIEVKMAERDERQKATEKAARRQKLLEVYTRKQDQAYDALSLEELNKLIDETV